MADNEKKLRVARFGFEQLGLSGRGSDVTKDELIKNAFYEEEAYRAIKRPGLTLDTEIAGLCGAGIYSFEDDLISVADDNVYKIGSGSSFSAYELRSSSLPRRLESQAISYDGALWFIGGRLGAPTFNDVYKSIDGGATWSTVTSSAAWGGRYQFASCVHDGKMWISGGDDGGTYASGFKNDVYWSTDGVTWNQARADGSTNGFTKVQRHSMVSFDGKLWIIGGEKDVSGAGTASNEVWYSTDGGVWVQATASAGWAGRAKPGVLVHDNKLWVLSGQGGSYFADAWYSSDGVTWTEATGSASFTGRYNPIVFSSNGYMYFGFGDSSSALDPKDLWRSADGVTWENVHNTLSPLTDSNPEEPSGVFHSDGAIYVFEGTQVTTPPSNSRVWRSTLDIEYSSLGSITSTSCEPIGFAELQLSSNNKLFLKTARDAWQLTSAGLTQITDADYPLETVPGVVALDGYIFVMTPKAEIYNSDLETPTSWNALNFINAEMEPDAGVALAKHLNYVVALGKWTTEFFYDAANATGSPLARLESSSLWLGCASAHSVVNIGNNLIWVAKDRTKGRFVIALEGLTAQRVSTPAVDRILTASTLTTVQSYPVMLDGHLFYVLNLVDDGLTLVMDLMTKRWAVWTTLTAGSSQNVTSIVRAGETATVTVTAHGYSEGDIVTLAGADQSDYNGDFIIHNVTTNTFDVTVRNSPTTPATGTITVKGYTESQFIGAYYAFNGETNYLQDKSTGDVYSISSSVYKDGSSPINVRVRTRDHDMDTIAGKFFANMRLHADREESFVSLRWSDDDFQTYSKFRDKWLDLDVVHFDRLGRFRRRAFEVAHVGNTAFRIAYLEAVPELGDH